MYNNYTPLVVTQYQELSNTNLDFITTQEIISFLKGEGEGEEDILCILRDASIGWFEKKTNRQIQKRQWKGFLDCFPVYSAYAPYYKSCQEIEIRKTPLITVDSIQYKKDGVLTNFDPSNYSTTFSSNGYSTIFLLDGKSYPSDVDNTRQAVEITFTSGYNNACDMPSDIKIVLLNVIASLYFNNSDCVDESYISPMTKDMCMKYKIYSL